ncbi:hypothetical protein [Aquimarina brevivitae]|uniref:Uncharacterized protein n=1 Tax=Aquimarina brevivitae TaxID=323412 RepID=A0A4Q7PI75_9FLAO|nr:hypothetical protein [Aquimarina brevivitae]RZT00312.1 hypothetical protein EV197_1548 [Aquimarina brevivitae]
MSTATLNKNISRSRAIITSFFNVFNFSIEEASSEFSKEMENNTIQSFNNVMYKKE